MGTSLEKASSRQYMTNWEIWCSSKIKPVYSKMKMIVESAGGNLLKDEPNAWANNIVIICDEAERRLQKRMEDIGLKC